MKFKKALACIMCASMVCASLTGCGSDEAKTAENITINESNDKVYESAEDQELEAVVKHIANAGSSSAAKQETVYVKTNPNGVVDSVVVSNWLKNVDNTEELIDSSDLNDITNVKGDEEYQIDKDGNITETLNTASGHIVKTYTNVEPRLSAKLKLSQLHSLKLGYSRTSQDIHAISGMSMSMPFDRYTMTSNIVRPEQADQVALGWMGITPHGNYDFSAEAYYKNIRNVYDYRDGKAFYSEIEIERLILGGKGRAYGVELCAHKNNGPLMGWISYTLSWSENKIEGVNGGRWYAASNDRRHDMAIVGMYHLSPSWELAATWRYNTGQALTAPSAKYDIDGTTFYYYNERNGYRAPAYHRLDLSATYTKKLRKATRIWSFGIYNAYCHYNPFTIRFKNDDKSPTGTIVEQTSLFGIVPSVSFTMKY